MKITGLIGLIIGFGLLFLTPAFAQAPPEIHLAVEFLDHAACAHIARNQNWYKAAGLNIRSFDSYATGMALSAALCKGGIDAAYMCLFPAINACANAKVPIKIVAGTHRYGYGLIVNPEKIKSVADLSKPDIRIGCTQEGSPPAALLHKLVEKYHLDASLLNRTRRMPPPKLLLALKSGQLDAAFLPEQFPTLGEMAGFTELLRAADLWPDMQGSVLVVREELLETRPEDVRKLVQLTKRGIQYITDHPDKAAQIVSDELNVMEGRLFPVDLAESLGKLAVTPAAIQTSLTAKLENTAKIDPKAIQEAIDYAARIGYIQHAFPAEKMLELKYLHE